MLTKSTLVAVPLKTSGEVQFEGPMRRYLQRVYFDAAAADNAPRLLKMRVDCVGSSADATGRDMYLRYYIQLDALDQRLGGADLGLAFSWSGGLVAGSHTQLLFAFEKANVLFNLAATLLHIGAHALAADDDYKLLCAAFQQAAGVFGFIADNFLHAPASDLHPDTTRACAKLMVAQAQEVFALKMVADGKLSTPLFPKVLAACALLYHAAHLMMEASHALFRTPTVHYAYIKSYYYQLMAEYSQGVQLEPKRQGDALAYWQQAHTTLKDHGNKFTLVDEYVPFKETLKQFNARLELEIARLDKENDFIYHARVPPASELETVKPLEWAKPVTLAEAPQYVLILAQQPDLFDHILPMAVHELNSVYDEDKAVLVRSESEVVDTADQELQLLLEYLRLPRAMVELRTALRSNEATDVPPEVLAMAHEIHAAESWTPLQQRIAADRAAVQQLLQQASAALARAPAATAAHQEVLAVKQALMKALESDATVARAVAPYSRDLELMASQPPTSPAFRQYVALFGDAPAAQAPSLVDMDLGSLTLDADLAALEELLADLARLRAERSKVYQALQQHARDDDILTVLVRNLRQLAGNTGAKDAIFAQELAKFKPHTDRLRMNASTQTLLVGKLKTVWNRILSDPRVVEYQQQQARQQLSLSQARERVEEVYRAWRQGADGYASAGKFYRELRVAAERAAVSAERAAATVAADPAPPPVPRTATGPGLALGSEPSLIYNQPSVFDRSMYGMEPAGPLYGSVPAPGESFGDASAYGRAPPPPPRPPQW